MAFPIALQGLTTREAVLDAVYRGSLAFDLGDTKLFESAMTEDAVMDLNGRVFEGLETISKLHEDISPLDTTHFVTNHRIDLKDGETRASVTTNFLAQHYRHQTGAQPDAPRFLVGGMYFVELVKDEKDGLWKVTHWTIKSIWNEGDRSIMPRH